MFKWLKKLFGKKNEYITTKSEPSQEVELIAPTKKEDEVKVEQPAICKDEEKSVVEVPTEEAVEEESVAEITVDLEYKNFGGVEIVDLMGIMKSIVKMYREKYFSIYHKAVMIENPKTLKTYHKLVDDKTLLIFYFTQSSEYNKQIHDFVKKHILSDFKCAIGDEIYNYDIKADDGLIKMRKIK